MAISKKVGAFLNKKQNTSSTVNEHPLYCNLVKTTLPQPTAQTTSIVANTPPNELGARLEESSPHESPDSLLNLDFMATPLTEVKTMTQHNTPDENFASHTEDALQELLPEFDVPSPVATTVKSIEAEGSQPAALIPSVKVTSSNDAINTALAQSVKGNTKIGSIVIGEKGNLIEASDTFYDIIGFTEEEKRFKTYFDLLEIMAKKSNLDVEKAKTLREAEIKKMTRLIKTEEFHSFTWKTILKTGKTIEFQNSYTQNNHLVVHARDITDQTERNRLLRVGLEIGTSGYWSYSFTTERSVLSDYFTEKLSEAEQQRANEQGFLSLIHPEDAQRVQSLFEATVRDHTRMDCFFKLETEKSGLRHMRLIGEVETSPKTGQKIAFIAFINDVTNDTHRKEELRAAKEASQHKSAFLARMSHEIKTPLNAIVGMTDALRDEVENDEARETASYIADAAENLNTILSQTLEHERLMTNDIILDEEETDITELSRSVLAMWKKPCKNKNIDLRVKLSPDLPTALMIDTSRLRQCITNLMSNAVKFTETGSVSLVVTPINLTSPSPRLIIAVKDTGIGMSEDAAANIFKPFRQGDETIQRRFGGSGLGMSITHHIVSAMGGNIKVKSAHKEGTTIILSLPLITPQAVESSNPDREVVVIDETEVTGENTPLNAQTAPPPFTPSAPLSAAPAVPIVTPTPVMNSPEVPQVRTPKAEAPETLSAETFHPATSADKSEKPSEDLSPQPQIRKNIAIEPSAYSGFDVLVVEDNPINQAVVRKLLSKYINSMQFAFHGQEAMEILETQSFDVILMDIHMPVKDGIETTLEIRNSGKPWADTVIIALTADPDFQQKRVCRNIGMNDALSKPVKRQDLLDVLQKVLDERENAASKKTAAA